MSDASKVTFTRRDVYDTLCRRCHSRQTFATQTELLAYIAKHEAQHVQSEAVGPTLIGKVLDVSTVPTWLGRITEAVEYAKRAGSPYISWNGYVYVTDDVDFNSPFAWASDVPDLTEAKR